jgi:hypothetical protein
MWRWLLVVPILFALDGVVRAATGSAMGDRPAVPIESGAEPELRIAAGGAPLRGTVIFADGSSSNRATFDVGAQIDYLHALASRMRWGVGLRYGFGSGVDGLDGRDSEHFVVAPFLIGLFWQLHHGQELEILAGAGLAAGRFTSAPPGPPAGSTSFDAWGLGGELTVSYALALTARLALSLGVSARGVVLRNTNSRAPPIEGGSAYHGEAPILIGLRFRL